MTCTSCCTLRPALMPYLKQSPHPETGSIVSVCQDQQAFRKRLTEGLALLRRQRWSRKTAAQRARRMAGQGLGPLMNKKPDIVIAPPSRSTLRLARRDSPTYDPYRSGRALFLYGAGSLLNALAPLSLCMHALLRCLG